MASFSLRRTFLASWRMPGLRRLGPVLLSLLLFPVSLSAESEAIRVGVYDNPPKAFLNEAGEAAGFWPDLVRLIAEKNQLKIQWEYGSWDELMHKLERGDIQIMIDVALTRERQERFLFGDQTIHVSWSRVYTAPDVKVSTIPELQGLRIAALEGSINLEGPEGLRALLRRFSVNAEIVEMADYPSIFHALESGRVDAAVTNRDFGNQMEQRFEIVRTPILFQPADLRFAFSPANPNAPGLVETFDRGMRELKANPNSEYYRLQDRWLGLQRDQEKPFPAWFGWVLGGLLGTVLILLAGIFVVELRVRARTRTIRDQQKALERQGNHLKESNQGLSNLLESRRSIINSLPAQIALLDEQGRILETNEHWAAYRSDEGFSGARFPAGTDYIVACEEDRKRSASEINRVVKGLTDVLLGRAPEFSFEYSDHTLSGLKWFRMSANPLISEQGSKGISGIVVMHQDITDRKLAELELNRLAFQDPVTGLRSRNGFTRSLQSRLANEGWKPDGLLMVLDIVSMRDINDVHGYAMGDQFLIQMGYRLRALAGEGGVAGRTGGDEFVLYLPLESQSWEADLIPEIISELSAPINLGDVEISSSLRCGFTRPGEQRRTAESLIREAELALYQSREEPGQTYKAYSEELSRATQQRIQLTREMRLALARNEFEMYYQPKIHLKDGAMYACEALIRWNHPQRGMQSPALFIPVAEKSQLISPMGDWILDRVCRQLRDWQEQGLEPVPVAINVSLVQLRSGEFPARAAETLRKYKLAPSLLSLEITESVFEQESAGLQEQLLQLHGLGIQLSLDDFGTGYSSLSYLHNYPFDEIKIDRSFVRNLHSSSTREIVKAIVSLAAALGAEVVAEGIEEENVRGNLLSMGCHHGQGFLFCKPVPAAEFKKLLQTRTSFLPT
ncbi:MAG: EAL domain-containing protein [Leptospiraceae bacterium]|nr:EAL domain-containing protein [Leptospiraceae bacterium]